MKSVVVVYSSKSDNTAKIAQAIATEVNCQALKISNEEKVSTVDLKSYELVFVGTGIYAGNPNADMEKYLRMADFGDTKQFAFFITWGGAGTTCQLVTEKLRSILEMKGQKVTTDIFSCYGGWRYALLRRGHPNIKDLEDARRWSREIVSHMQK
ncbi:MAG: flavodoxin domain-containing protein [Candidatus Bathyarchaeota archaeon]|nr:flavodoxin domain-containing protein [Candidatus Bathyarchaeota archaeon]